MKHNWFPHIIVWLSVAAMALAACAPSVQADPATPATLAATATSTTATYSDPFAYCAAVGNIDEPDARYTGPKTSDVIFKGFLKAAGLDANGDYPDAFKQMTTWRCMNKLVYACNFGANLPCNSKANTDKTTTQAMADYCKENLNSDFIPMAITGHSTIYSWHCVKDTPELLDQIDKVDAAGYLSSIWYPLQATP